MGGSTQVVKLPENGTLKDKYDWAADGQYYRWVDDGTPNDSTGGTNPTPQAQVKHVIGVASQTFRVTCWGLKPNTVHSAFLVNKDVSSDCIPTSGVYSKGGQLKTGADGTLVFDYQFKPERSPYSTTTVQGGAVVAIIPAGNQKFKVSSADGRSRAESFIISHGVTK